MSEPIITPKKTWRERAAARWQRLSPQERQAIIAGLIVIPLTVVGWIFARKSSESYTAGSNDNVGAIVQGNRGSNLLVSVDQSTRNDQHAATINNNYFVTIQAKMVRVVQSTTNPVGIARDHWESFTNEYLRVAISFGRREFMDAFQHATNCINLLESHEGEGVIPAGMKASVYEIAAVCVDTMEINPHLAYELATKGWNYDKTDIYECTVAMTAHNLATQYAMSNNFLMALELERQTITVYDRKSAVMEVLLSAGSSWKYYQHGAVYAGRFGYFEEADRYSRVAVDKNPSRPTLEVRISVLHELGKDAEVNALIEHWFDKKVNQSGKVEFVFRTNAARAPH